MSLVEGAIAVKAVLNSKYRKVEKIYISQQKSGNDVSYILQCANKYHVEVVRPTAEEMENICKGKSSGGIAAEVGERKTQTVTSILKKQNCFLAYLEGIEDSYNLGYIFRTLYAMGCDGVIMKERYIDYDDTTLVKSSAGASELLPIVYTDDIKMTIDILKQNGVKVVSAYRGNNPICLYDYDFSGSVMVCVGGPLRGLNKTILDNSDDYIYIPYGNDFRNALNAASAVSVISGEIFRQKREK